MKVAFAENNIQGSRGLQESTSFQIRTNAHAFKLLSSGLYKNKIAAVLREIGCNAADAHTEAGISQTPFEVKLPNRLDSQVYIKDFGLGLSHEDIMSLYTTYFASTKQDSNDFTGAFGLGSKSPFSYTDSFVITSCHKGQQRIYSAHLDNTGAPRIALMSKDRTEEHGLTIAFPVPPADFSHFASNATTIYGWFDPIPKVLGTFPIQRPELQHETPQYILCARNQNELHSVLMGNVLYPLEFEPLKLTSDHPIAKLFAATHRIILKLPIGTIQITASREGIQYDPNSIKQISAALEHVGKDIVNDIRKLIADIKSKNNWQAYCRLPEQIKTRIISRDYLEDFLAHYVQDGAERDEMFNFCTKNTMTLTLIDPANDVIRYITKHPRRKALNQTQFGNTLDVPLHANMKIVYGQAPYLLKRLNPWISAEGVLVVTGPTAAVTAQAVSIKLGTLPLVPIETLPIPKEVAEQTARVKITRKKGIAPLPHQETALLDEEKKLFIDEAKPAQQYYIIQTNKRHWRGSYSGGVRLFSDAKNEVTFRSVVNAWRAYKTIDDKIKSSIIVTPSEARLLQLQKRGWKELTQTMKETISTSEYQKKIQTLATTWRAPVDIRIPRTSLNMLAYLQTLQIKLPVSLGKILEQTIPTSAAQQIQTKLESHSTLTSFLNIKDIDDISTPTAKSADTLCDEINQQFPAFAELSRMLIDAIPATRQQVLVDLILEKP